MRFFYKMFVFIVCAIFILAGTAYAGSTLSIQDKSASPADTVMVPLVLKSSSQLSALSTDLSYNADRLQFNDASIGVAASNKKVVANSRGEGKVRIGLISMDSTVLNDGKVINVSFVVDPEAEPGKVQIEQEVSGSTPDGEETDVNGESGTIDVSY